MRDTHDGSTQPHQFMEPPAAAPITSTRSVSDSERFRGTRKPVPVSYNALAAMLGSVAKPENGPGWWLAEDVSLDLLEPGEILKQERFA